MGLYRSHTDFSLSFSFVVLNIGRPQKHVFHNPSERSSLDVCFLSVVGGYRPPNEQILLLKQMEKAAKACKAEFVIGISQLGEGDPLMQNAIEHFQSLGVSWYMTQKESEPDYYLKKIAIPGGHYLDIITVNTKFSQDPTTRARNRLLWSRKMLEENISDWCILVGFDPLLPCNGSVDGKHYHESLQHIFSNSGMNAYLSGLACAEYIEKEVDERGSHANGMLRGPFLITPNNIFQPNENREIAFLLHTVSSLELATYSVTLKGEVVHKTTLQQRGKEVM